MMQKSTNWRIKEIIQYCHKIIATFALTQNQATFEIGSEVFVEGKLHSDFFTKKDMVWVFKRVLLRPRTNTLAQFWVRSGFIYGNTESFRHKVFYVHLQITSHDALRSWRRYSYNKRSVTRKRSW